MKKIRRAGGSAYSGNYRHADMVELLIRKGANPSLPEGLGLPSLPDGLGLPPLPDGLGLPSTA